MPFIPRAMRPTTSTACVLTHVAVVVCSLLSSEVEGIVIPWDETPSWKTLYLNEEIPLTFEWGIPHVLKENSPGKSSSVAAGNHHEAARTKPSSGKNEEMPTKHHRVRRIDEDVEGADRPLRNVVGFISNSDGTASDDQRFHSGDLSEQGNYSINLQGLTGMGITFSSENDDQVFTIRVQDVEGVDGGSDMSLEDVLSASEKYNNNDTDSHSHTGSTVLFSVCLALLAVGLLVGGRKGYTYTIQKRNAPVLEDHDEDFGLRTPDRPQRRKYRHHQRSSGIAKDAKRKSLEHQQKSEPFRLLDLLRAERQEALKNQREFTRSRSCTDISMDATTPQHADAPPSPWMLPAEHFKKWMYGLDDSSCDDAASGSICLETDPITNLHEGVEHVRQRPVRRLDSDGSGTTDSDVTSQENGVAPSTYFHPNSSTIAQKGTPSSKVQVKSKSEGCAPRHSNEGTHDGYLEVTTTTDTVGDRLDEEATDIVTNAVSNTCPDQPEDDLMTSWDLPKEGDSTVDGCPEDPDVSEIRTSTPVNFDTGEETHDIDTRSDTGQSNTSQKRISTPKDDPPAIGARVPAGVLAVALQGEESRV